MTAGKSVLAGLAVFCFRVHQMNSFIRVDKLTSIQHSLMDGTIKTRASSRVLEGVSVPCTVDPFATTFMSSKIVMKPRRMRAITYFTLLGIKPGFIGRILMGFGQGPDIGRHRWWHRTGLARQGNKSCLKSTGLQSTPDHLLTAQRDWYLTKRVPTKLSN